MRHQTYSIEQIAGSYQCSHVSLVNMPSDDEFLHALQNNGHDASKLDELKNEYCRIARLVCR
jgi:hypothetical protein